MLLDGSGDMTDDGEGVRGPTVVIVDYRRLFREGFRLLLEQGGEFEVVAEADSMASAVRYIRGHRPALALVGLAAPKRSDAVGWTGLVDSIRSASPETSVLLVASDADARRLAGGLEAGATGAIEMDASGVDLREAARRLASGQAHLPPSIALEILRETRGVEGDLTSREEKLLGEIALGYTNAEIAEHLHLSVRTIESHRSRIQDKLGASSRAELVREALDRELVS